MKALQGKGSANRLRNVLMREVVRFVVILFSQQFQVFFERSLSAYYGLLGHFSLLNSMAPASLSLPKIIIWAVIVALPLIVSPFTTPPKLKDTVPKPGCAEPSSLIFPFGSIVFPGMGTCMSL